jgi:hypothetical protein
MTRLTIRKFNLDQKALILGHLEQEGMLSVLSNSKDCAMRDYDRSCQTTMYILFAAGKFYERPSDPETTPNTMVSRTVALALG